jgi:hypothetical protein
MPRAVRAKLRDADRAALMVVNKSALLPQSGRSRSLAREQTVRGRTRSSAATGTGDKPGVHCVEGVTSRMWHQPDGGWRVGGKSCQRAIHVDAGPRKRSADAPTLAPGGTGGNKNNRLALSGTRWRARNLC